MPLSPFDPEAATAAYLATLPAADLARAIAYTRGSHWLLLMGSLVSVFSCWLIIRSRLLVRLRGRMKSPNLAVFLCTILFFGLDWVIRSPFFAYDWWRDGQYGLTKQPMAGWLAQSLAMSAINALCSGLLALALYALIRRTSRWWAWSGLVTVTAIFTVVLVTPVAIEPLFNRYEAAPAGPTREAISALARSSDIPADDIVVYDGSRQSERYTARVSGILSTARIAISDTMLQQGADISEIRAVVGHEIGHYARGHILITVVVYSLLAIWLFALVDRLFPMLLRRLDRRQEIAGLADPAGIPVVMILIAVLSLFATPLINTMIRMQELDADRFSLEHAREPDGMARALIKSTAYRAPSPAWMEEILFYDHPSVERRVRNAMYWRKVTAPIASSRR